MPPTDHVREVSALWSDFGARRNSRVPVTFAIDDQVWLKVSRHSYRELYTDPRIHVEAQLQGKKWFSGNVVCDLDPTYPERWTVATHYWMEENEFFGCKTAIQENDYAWAMPLDLDREDLLAHIRAIDPEETVRRSQAFWLYSQMKDLAAGLTFEDRPVDVAHRFGTDGIFTKAAEVRGLERLCEDLSEAPGFVDEYLGLITEKTIERMKAWHRLATGQDVSLPSPGGFGICDDSLQMISAADYERFVLPWHELLYSTISTGPRGIHLCGRSMQHYPALRWKLGVTSIDGPGPFADHGRYLAEYGPKFSFNAQMDHAVLAYGSAAEVEGMVRGVLTAAAKQPGRFQLMGLLCRDTPPENVQAAYRAGREYGAVRAD